MSRTTEWLLSHDIEWRQRMRERDFDIDALEYDYYNYCGAK